MKKTKNFSPFWASGRGTPPPPPALLPPLAPGWGKSPPPPPPIGKKNKKNRKLKVSPPPPNPRLPPFGDRKKFPNRTPFPHIFLGKKIPKFPRFPPPPPFPLWTRQKKNLGKPPLGWAPQKGGIRGEKNPPGKKKNWDFPTSFFGKKKPPCWFPKKKKPPWAGPRG